jgi:hypothetical protein
MDSETYREFRLLETRIAQLEKRSGEQDEEIASLREELDAVAAASAAGLGYTDEEERQS